MDGVVSLRVVGQEEVAKVGVREPHLGYLSPP